ncbi:hypothetical protein JVT61DRAFT_8735 [Boletus reticuloceps]|uniref:Uncharacterized protein n=1 Tax=Boletus reticuloceps TaxID=495285 RepID=A0A8I3A6I6_9AGAM|nr:hypothetical protein JVT61DRAFT_8735 [Boletus reticuloceps]
MIWDAYISLQGWSDNETPITNERPLKKQHAADILTIFSDHCTVKFCHENRKVKELKGRWCNMYKCTHMYSKGMMRSTFRNIPSGKHSILADIHRVASISGAIMHCTRNVVENWD